MNATQVNPKKHHEPNLRIAVGSQQNRSIYEVPGDERGTYDNVKRKRSWSNHGDQA